MALACSPALCANADVPTYGWREAGGTLVTSATAWAMRVASRSRPWGSTVRSELELEVGDDGDEVGVAGALAVAVDAALHVRGAGRDRGERVGNGTAAVVVGVDADAGAGGLDHVEHDVGDPVGQHAAVGVAERDDLGAGLGSGAEDLERVLAVGAVAVEEVLGVEEHRLPLLAQVGDGVAHHREVLLQRGAQRELDVAVVRLRDEGDDPGAAVAEGCDVRVVRGAYAGPARRPERCELCVPEVELRSCAAEELGVLGVRAGHPPSM